MTSISRSTQFAKVHKVLKKCCKTSPANAGRTVVEQLLFACCLEDASHEAAEEAFAALVHTFFDWNEVRVTSISELSEVMACLPDPRAAANRVKRVLHAIFETTFNFDLEELRKKNLGPTVEWLGKLDGMTRFTTSYAIQAALGGHAIPIDAGTMGALRVLDLATEKDAASGVVAGLERAVAKSKGVEFGALLHELGAMFSANPYSPATREIFTQIDPECVGRLPKRRASRPLKKSAEPVEDKPVKGVKGAAAGKAPSGKKPSSPAPEPPKKKSAPASPARRPAEKRSTEKHVVGKVAAEKGKEKSSLKTVSKRTSASEGLAKRKPR